MTLDPETTPGTADLWSLSGAERPGAPELPVPERERFQPLRAGILNLWQYDDQELRFHQGRLILRGENGTGKSKALEVLLPFLLDADLSPHRLDPFAGTARTMRWNLLEGDRHESRVGYVWLELGRLGDDGEPQYVTLGCGLRATRRTSRVESWYFVTPLRIGGGLALTTASRHPLMKDQLRRALGDDGALYDQGSDYRERVDAVLYGLGADRFGALRHLMLQLRRPHLSEKLDPRTLSELLTESLPPVDPELVAQLSEGFERLEHDQEELRRVEAAHAAVSSFLGVYREYAGGVARGRAAEVRQANSRFHKTAAEVREAKEALDRVEGEIEALGGRLDETAAALDETEGRIRALEASDAMRSAEALRARAEHLAEVEARSGRDRADAEREGEAAERRSGEWTEARERAAETERAAGAPGRRAEAAAAEAGLEAIHAPAAGDLEQDAERARGAVRAAVEDRRRAADELAGLAHEAQAAGARHERRHERRLDAEGQVQAALERSRRAAAALEAAHEAFEEALSGWAGGLAELALSPAELERLAELAAAATGGEEAPAAALARLATPRRDDLVRRRTELEAERREAAGERDAVAAERARVEAAREVPPEAPRTREAERAGRPGAPLYLLCDFADGLAEAERAGLEAALEAAGLLDAWLLPDGRLLGPDTRDTVLVPAPREGPGTLADLLVPRPEAGVEAAVIEATLRSIAVGGPEGEAPHRVGPDGTWRLGPLHGTWGKARAEHVGASAREEARRRRLADLDRELAGLDERLDRVAAEVRAAAARIERLDAEVASLPSAAPLAAARHRSDAAAEDERRRRTELREAESAAAEARREREAADERLAERARELRLAAWVADLEGYRARLAAYQAAFLELAQAVVAAAVASRAAAQAETLAREAEERADEARHRAEEAEGRARRARSELEELRSSVGAEAEEVVARHRAEVEARERLAAERERLAEERSCARERRGEISGRVGTLEGQLTEREAERARAVGRLRRLAEAGLLALLLPETRVPSEPPAEWSMTRTLEIARAVEQAAAELELDTAEEAANRRANRMHERFRAMAADLGVEFSAGFAHDEELQVARVAHDQREFDLPGLLATLEGEITARRSLLEERERDLLRRFLLGEVGDHLRGRLRDAHTLVEDMNRDLGSCATASGMTLRLAWRPDEEAGPSVRQAVELLRRDVELLAEADRRLLEEFFERRIEAARQDAAAVPWREHLLAALDYRRWYRFTVLRRLPGEPDWKPLTRHGHAAASGGERAVALHLPLFAAASAHYKSALPTAPRLILLDEAFAGIDLRMRGRCMGLLVEFDLDFMMTSHDEWGCYRELPGVATYQLFRDPALGGVATVRCVWNGERLVEEPMGAG